MISTTPVHTDKYFTVNKPSMDPEIVRFKHQVENFFQKKRIDHFSRHEMIYLADSGIYPVDQLNQWLVDAIVHPGTYLLPATQIKAGVSVF